MPSELDNVSTESHDNVWSTILRDVQLTGGNKLPKNKAVVFLGDDESGKSSLVAKLQGFEEACKGEGLEYHYLAVKDDREDRTNLNVWILGGEAPDVHMLDYVIKTDNINDVIALVVLPMNKPWCLMESLQRWVTSLRDHIDKLDLTLQQFKLCEQRVIKLWQDYVAPDETRSLTSSMSVSMSRSVVSGGGGDIAGSNVESTVLNGSAASTNRIGDEILSKNLGIQIIVVVSKTDCMMELEKEQKFTDEHFDFIQYNLRKACMQLGAGLIYYSSLNGKNCDLLYRYIMHQQYGFHFGSPALVIDRDTIFVPAGWDSDKKLQILAENLRSISAEQEFSNIIQKPVEILSRIQRDVEVQVESEQEFLSRMLVLLQKDIGAESTSVISAGDTPRLAGGKGSPVGIRRGSQPKPKIDAQENTMLQTFFSSLLSRTAGGAAGPASPGVSPAARSPLSPADMDRLKKAGALSTPLSTNASLVSDSLDSTPTK